MSNLVVTGLGGSRQKKESEKDFYWKPDLLVPGSGIAFELVDIAQPGPTDSEGRALYAQSAQTWTGVKVSTVAADMGPYATDADLAAFAALIPTISGDLVAQIPSLTGYATQSYVTTVSGDLVNEISTTSGVIVAQIPSLTGYATQSFVTIVSGVIVAQIPTVSGYTGTVTVSGATFTVANGLITTVA